MGLELIPKKLHDYYEIHEWRHACAVLSSDYPSEWRDILDVLANFTLKKSAITVGGGGKSLVSQDLRVASVGIIVTKSDELRDTFTDLGIWSKYGTSTTWMNKLLPRIEGGGGGGCPLLVFGITKQLFDPRG